MGNEEESLLNEEDGFEEIDSNIIEEEEEYYYTQYAFSRSLGPVDHYSVNRISRKIEKNMDYDDQIHSRRLLLAKAVYFFVFSADACVEPYQAVVLDKRRFPHWGIGSMLTLLTISNAVSGQIFTGMADRYSCHRNIVLTAFTLFVLCFSSLVFQNAIWYTVLLCICGQIAWGPVLPMMDNVTIFIVRQAQREDYSRQRLFTAIGWGLFCFLDGWLMDVYGYKVLFFMLTILGFFSLVLLSFYPFHELHQRRHHDDHTEKKIISWSEIGSFVMQNVLMLPFLSCVLLIGYLFSTIDGYLALYILTLNGSTSLVGTMYGTACLVDIPFFYWSDRIYQRVGMKWILFGPVFAYFIRLCSYSFLYNPNLVLCIEPFHALTYALFWGPAVTFVNDVLLKNSPKLKGTGQGSFFAAFYTGRAIGYSVSGWIAHLVGLRLMFRFSLLAVATLFLLVLNFFRLTLYYGDDGSNYYKNTSKQALQAANWAQEWCDDEYDKEEQVPVAIPISSPRNNLPIPPVTIHAAHADTDLL